MDVSDTEEDSLPCTQAPLSGKDLSTVLIRKYRPRRKLLRADHHRVFLHKCHTNDVTPKGLRLSRQVHPIQGTGSSNTSAKIENILLSVEKGILEALIEHYDGSVESTTDQLQDIQEELSRRPTTYQEETDSSTHRAELSEDILRSSLKKTRNEKLKKLRGSRPTHPTPSTKT